MPLTIIIVAFSRNLNVDAVILITVQSCLQLRKTNNYFSK